MSGYKDGGADTIPRRILQALSEQIGDIDAGVNQEVDAANNKMRLLRRDRFKMRSVDAIDIFANRDMLSHGNPPFRDRFQRSGVLQEGKTLRFFDASSLPGP